MNNTRIIRMSGGLEEQLYQYAFLRYIEISTHEKCLVDDSDLCVGDNVYELERAFGVKLNLLSDYFSGDVWNEIMNKKAEGYSVPQQLLDNEMNIMLLTETDDNSFSGNSIKFDPKLVSEGVMTAYANARGNVYYQGSFATTAFAFGCAEALRNELVFPMIKETLDKDTINVRYAELMDVTHSVALYIKGNSLFETYAGIMDKMEKRGEKYTYFIFSDDIEWCKTYRKELGLKRTSEDVIFVEENLEAGNRYIDMHLMGLCKKLIMTNEEFVKWAYYLHVRNDLELIDIN